jgi:hypothetical protein
MKDQMVEQELDALAGETLAIQVILAKVLHRVRGVDPALADAIAVGFNDAANQIEDIAIRFGKAASPEHTVKAIKIVEQLRTAVLGNHDKPRDAV